MTVVGFHFKWWLCGVALLASLLSLLWAWRVPVPLSPENAAYANWFPDEGSHLQVIQHMAEQHTLPPYRFPYDTSVHPPLMHFVGAVLWAALAPWLGGDGVVRLLRTLGAILGGLTVYLIGQTARTLTDDKAGLLASSLAALIPTRIACAGGVTNETLAALAAAGLFHSLTLAPQQRWKGIALWSGIGCGAKLTVIALLPGIALALWRQKDKRALAAMAAVSSLAWGWWFGRNAVLYGDPLRSAAADRLWDSVQPGWRSSGLPLYRYLWRAMLLSWHTFWGVFDGMRHQLPKPAYIGLVAGHLAALWGARRIPKALLTSPWALAALVGAAGVLVVFVGFNLKHYSPQGRYLFVLLSPVALLMALGLRQIRFAPQLALSGLFGMNLWAFWRHLP